METNNDNNKLLIAYSDAYLDWKLGRGDGSHPTNPVRAKLAVDILKEEYVDLEIIEPTFISGDREKLEEIHSSEYVSEVLDFGESSEWNGRSVVNATTAGIMFGGTVRLVERMLESESGGGIRVAFNPQGAKHHAHAEYSSGFCVFNDMAWAAERFLAEGLSVAYLDWDVHAGDGVQAILKRRGTDACTYSVHGHGIFPARWDTSVAGKAEGNYIYSDEEEGWFNYNLIQGTGDEGLLWAVTDALMRMEEAGGGKGPDVLLMAIGADGHEGEYWGLKYTLEGFIKAAELVKEAVERWGSRVLIGGAGGYQPYDWTPRIWAEVVKVLAGARG